MNYWQVVTAVCAVVGMAVGGLNAYQNIRIELKIELLRNDLLSKEIGPLKERVSTLEAEVLHLKRAPA